MQVSVQRLPGRTPLLLIEVAGQAAGAVLLYGHLDKQPAFTGWAEGLGQQPVLRDGRLYGRGGADDGYAVFSSLSAIAALQAQGVAHARCVILIEACEESGSTDLPAHLGALGEQLGEALARDHLDAESGNYEQLWCTTSLRGVLAGVLQYGCCAKACTAAWARASRRRRSASPSSCSGGWRIPSTATSCHANCRSRSRATGSSRPAPRRRARRRGRGRMPFVNGARPGQRPRRAAARQHLARDPRDHRGRRPAADRDGRQRALPEIALKLSLRLPPTTDAAQALGAVRAQLERDPPYGAQVSFEGAAATAGWNAPSFASWLEESMQQASQAVFGRPAVHAGCGGSIPFMGMLGRRFPAARSS
ncbi:MAG: M20/M25/M40 family metallo-hydrolase [Steroidobacteraceae bacterium]